MKLAEALKLRADNRARLNELRNRLCENAQVQEGEKPAEDPEDLLKEYRAVLAEQKQLIKQINITNVQTVVNGKSIMEMITDRDALTSEINALRSLIDGASNNSYRSFRTEIKNVSTVDIAALHKEIDRLSKAHRELDMKIQELNWSTDIR